MFLEKSPNATYVALIPKKNGAKELRCFRDRQCIQLISKLLIEKLKMVMHKLVDTHQMAFIKGRYIMDVVLIANEYIDSKLKERKSGIYANWT